MNIPRSDRYKTVSLKTTDIEVARERAFDQDADIRFRLKHDVPVFNHPFREVGREYLLIQEGRAARGEISTARPKKIRAIIDGTLDERPKLKSMRRDEFTLEEYRKLHTLSRCTGSSRSRAWPVDGALLEKRFDRWRSRIG